MPSVDTLTPFSEGQGCGAGAFLDRLYRAYASRHGAARWGDKTPIYADHMELVHRILPEARFIHLIRDGRDVALSTVEQWGRWEWRTDMYAAIRTWSGRVRRAREAGRRLGQERYLEVRYESLVADPASTMRKLCAFLGEPFDPRMTAPSDAAAGWIEKDNRWHHRLHRPPSPSRSQRWRREMGEADQRLCEAVAGELLAELGYPLQWTGCRTPGRERVRRLALGSKYAGVIAAKRAMIAARVRPPS